MNGIAIYVEGGGATVHQRAELRIGFDSLLSAQKNAALVKRLRWRTVPSGGRQAAFEAFRTEQQRADINTLAILLVDSEAAVAAEVDDELTDANARVSHLAKHDGWDFKGIDPRQVHLMVQCMEAWIVADSNALSRYYGKGFHANKLPVRSSLEGEPKGNLAMKLTAATRDTSKGQYHKIRHASKLLARIDAEKVAHRCPRFNTFRKRLATVIEEA